MAGLFSLKGDQHFVTHEKQDAYRVTKGSALVYIVPWKNGDIGRRSFLYEAKEGEVIPSLSYQDLEYNSWRFCLVPVNFAELETIENGGTSVLRGKFAQRAGIDGFAVEGFEVSIVDRYKMNIVAEDGLIHKTGVKQVETAEETLGLIYRFFKKRGARAEQSASASPLYEAVKLVCDFGKTSLASLERIRESGYDDGEISGIAHASHLTFREILLEPGWHRSDSGAFVAFTDDGRPVACIPRGRGYIARFTESGERRVITKALAERIRPKAYAVYRPFPRRELGAGELLRFCLQSIRGRDIAFLALFTLIGSLIGLLLPTLNQTVYDELIPLGAAPAAIQLGCVILSFMLGNIAFSITKNILHLRAKSRIMYDVQNATYDRLFSLPESFFRRFESADLAQRVTGIGAVVETTINTVLGTFLIAVFSALYFVRMFSYSPRLAAISAVMILAYAAVVQIIAFRTAKYQRSIAELDGKANSMLYQYLSGISKIRIAGVEDRALYEYLKVFVQSREKETKKNAVTALGSALGVASGGLFSMVLYFIMVQSGMTLSIGEFLAFTAAFGVFSSSILQVFDGISNLRVVKPYFDRYKPILKAVPEHDESKEAPGDLTGAVEISNVTFSYAPDMPDVLKDVSLRIKPGEYIGVVGPSGCGKSTLLKLLLGFEAPATGKIYYDGKDLDALDKRQLRKKFGVVLQDGKLIAGSIYENITITAPNATLADVKSVIKSVGLEGDIDEMPMGLHTVLSEDCGTISGGQQQRILIARAIISRPKILFFDEATSALDNVTQAMVCDCLSGMTSTRVVIAHRLSTIMNCDRILVMNEGRVVEQGSYQELMSARGLFYDLASRQI